MSVTLIIVLLIIKKQRLKSTSHQDPDVDLEENEAYGVRLSMKINDAYGCSSNEEQHIYEEIVN